MKSCLRTFWSFIEIVSYHREPMHLSKAQEKHEDRCRRHEISKQIGITCLDNEDFREYAIFSI